MALGYATKKAMHVDGAEITLVLEHLEHASRF